MINTSRFGKDEVFNDLLVIVAKIKTCCSDILKHRNMFNRVSFSGASKANFPHVFMESIDEISQALSKYGHWKESALANASEPSIVNEALSTAMKVWSEVMRKSTEHMDNEFAGNPYKLLDTGVVLEGFNKLSALELTLYLSDDHEDPVVRMLGDAFVCAKQSMFETILGFAKQMDIALPLNPEKLYISEDEPLEITVHDEVVFRTPDEIQQAKEAEARAAAEAERKAQAQKKVDECSEHAKIVLKSYDQHLKVHSLTRVFIRPEALEILRNPQTGEDCAKVEALYSLLMSMSDSQRYMPGETEAPERRIYGSFMELDKDVCAYKTRFLVYTGSWGTSHNSVADALSMLAWREEGAPETEVREIFAQYIETKKYIKDKIVDDHPQAVRPFHLFVQ